MRYLVAILSLGLLIALHELGHLLFARLFRIRIERFAIGIGPALFSIRRRGTEFALKAIPVGAFVQVRGMNPHALNFDRSDRSSFASKNVLQKALVVLGGPLMNLAVAFSLLVGLYARGTHVPVAMTVGTVEPASEAAKAQLRPGDQIVALDGNPIQGWSALVEAIAQSAGRFLRVTLVRDGNTIDVPVKPRRDAHGAGRIGISQQYVFRQYAWREAAVRAYVHMRQLLSGGVRALRRLARENMGPEMAQRFSEASVSGIDSLVRAWAGLSLALAIFYLLPLPPLDGGRLALLAVEAIRRHPINSRMESLVSVLGMLVLVVGVAWLLARDVARFVLRAVGSGQALVSEPIAAWKEGPAPAPDDGGLAPEQVATERPDAGS